MLHSNIANNKSQLMKIIKNRLNDKRHSAQSKLNHFKIQLSLLDLWSTSGKVKGEYCSTTGDNCTRGGY